MVQVQCAWISVLIRFDLCVLFLFSFRLRCLVALTTVCLVATSLFSLEWVVPLVVLLLFFFVLLGPNMDRETSRLQAFLGANSPSLTCHELAVLPSP